MEEQVDRVHEDIINKLQTFLDSLSADERSVLVSSLRRSDTEEEVQAYSGGILSSGANDLNAADCWYVMTHTNPFGKTSSGQPWYPDGSNKNPGAGGKPK